MLTLTMAVHRSSQKVSLVFQFAFFPSSSLPVVAMAASIFSIGLQGNGSALTTCSITFGYLDFYQG